ncbi:two-partner secretion domain-containing protein [Candidatus Nitrospira allomarina]|uniref:Filamentous hemagglutinin N-terminal domain-containing protein n=1 Tax=Candidatus Nitrospira allomarina TaxID=3020900 RepID=A0AA96GEL1_9BACT|nr:filamentous hemagglutinin N-terminal domain-containing protein [Candidatus Nitrospira allomarina]WNM58595.1 filamentous hemagglutinin N-terminal domain-containing protein [Candidatus Nitrospira allomarina]
MRYVVLPLLTAYLVCRSFSTVGQAQLAPPITSSGLNTQVSVPVDLPGGAVQHNITGGTRPGGGGNLFHSFGEFGVPANNIANFLNDSGLPTSNILSRVTGGNTSNILGAIQTEGFGKANFFLMNPAGIVFGPNASLNVGGASHFTTADYLRLTDDVQFTALPGAQDALLSVAPVTAFGFLGNNPGTVSVNGSTLSVVEGQTLSLVGGDITIGSGLKAPDGRIHLASVGSPGEILSETLAQAPNVNGQSFEAMGTIHISEKSVINASGKGGGTVVIRGGRLVVDNSTISANIIGPTAGPSVGQPGEGIDIQVSRDVVIQNGASLQTNVSENAAPGIGSGGIHVKADRIEILGPQDFVPPDPSEPFDPLNPPDPPPFTGIRSNVADGSRGGPSGDILLEANSFLMNDFRAGSDVQIQANTSGEGNSGSISVRTSGNLDLLGSSIGGFSGSFSASPSSAGLGNAGNIELTSTAGNISISGSLVSSQSFGGGIVGSIDVNASQGNIVMTGPPADVFTFIQGTEGIEGNGGIQLTANNLIMRGARIAIDNIFSVVPGAIKLDLSGSLILSSGSINLPDGGSIPILSRVQTTTRGSARSSDLNITASDILITGNSFLSTETVDSGDAGILNILTNNLQVTDGGQLRSSSTINTIPQIPIIPSGAGGTVSIQGLASAADSIVIDGAGSGIFTDAQGTGSAGSTTLTAKQLTITSGGRIEASTSAQGAGGTINTLTDNTTISGVSSDGQTRSGIFSGTTGTDPGAGAGGTISLVANQNFTLSNGARVSASSSGQGDAGNIDITGHDTILIDKATVTTEATQASGGEIKLTANDTIQLVDSTIESTVKGDARTVAGNIELDPDFIILQNSHILAKAVDGQGGNITLIASKGVLVDAQSTLEVTSERGISGTVNIESPIQVLSGTIVPLPDQPVNVATLYAARCVAGEGGHFSTFVDSKSDSVAPTPGTFLASPFLPQVSPYPAGALGDTGTRSVDSGQDSTPSIQLAAYSPPVLFQHEDGMLSACP